MKTLSVFEHISVDGRAKRIHINAFSNKNASVWTGPNFGGLDNRVLNKFEQV